MFSASPATAAMEILLRVKHDKGRGARRRAAPYTVRSELVPRASLPKSRTAWRNWQLLGGRRNATQSFHGAPAALGFLDPLRVVVLRPHPSQVCTFFAWAALMLKFWKNPAGPCGARTYLPTYLPYLWETKKEIIRRVKVGYHTN